MTRLLFLFKSEKQLLREISKGNDNALAWLYDNHIRMITKYIANNSGNDDDAQEMLQEALILLWEKVRSGNFHLHSKLSTYIYAVVRNKWLKELERRKRNSDLDEARMQTGDASDSLQSLEQEELANMISVNIEKLSPVCRELLKLFYYENKSMADISNALGFANEDVAKSKKYQCKKLLEKLVKQAFQE